MRQGHQTGSYAAANVLGDVKFTSSAFNLPRMREGRAGKRAQELLREADGRRRAQRMSAFPESSETDCMCTMSAKSVLWFILLQCRILATAGGRLWISHQKNPSHDLHAPNTLPHRDVNTCIFAPNVSLQSVIGRQATLQYRDSGKASPGTLGFSQRPTACPSNKNNHCAQVLRTRPV